MQSDKERFRDRDIEQVMGNLLRFGVLASMAVVFTGAVLYLFQHGHEAPSYRQFHSEPKRLTDVKAVWQTAIQGRGRSIIQLGLFILIATPIARIVFSVIGYVLERDYLYVIITLIVLSVIIYSL